MNKGIIIGVIIVLGIIGVASGYLISSQDDSSVVGSVESETDLESPTGTYHSIELSESIAMEQIP